jgi:hypothetical protein
MILTLGFRGVFRERQEQYETAETITIEGSVTVDDQTDTVLDGMAQEEIRAFTLHELDKLIAPQLTRVRKISRFGADETVVYEWEGLVNDPASPAQDGTPERRVRRRQA